MTKFKYDIAKNNLSWEEYQIRLCDHDSCKDKGDFKAPKSRSNLNNYYFFCLCTN